MPRRRRGARKGSRVEPMSAALIALIVIVLLLAFGFAALGFALSVLWSLVWYGLVGLLIGGLARLVVSGRQDLSVFETAFLDVGWIGQFLTAVIIAALLVLAVGGTRSRGTA